MYLPRRTPRFVRRDAKEISPTEDISLARSTMRVMSALLAEEFGPLIDPTPPAELKPKAARAAAKAAAEASAAAVAAAEVEGEAGAAPAEAGQAQGEGEAAAPAEEASAAGAPAEAEAEAPVEESPAPGPYGRSLRSAPCRSICPETVKPGR